MSLEWASESGQWWRATNGVQQVVPSRWSGYSEGTVTQCWPSCMPTEYKWDYHYDTVKRVADKLHVCCTCKAVVTLASDVITVVDADMWTRVRFTVIQLLYNQPNTHSLTHSLKSTSSLYRPTTVRRALPATIHSYIYPFINSHRDKTHHAQCTTSPPP